MAEQTPCAEIFEFFSCFCPGRDITYREIFFLTSLVFLSAEAPFKMQTNKKKLFKKSFLERILHQFLSDMYHDIYVYVIRALKGAKRHDIYVYVIRALKGLRNRARSLGLSWTRSEVSVSIRSFTSPKNIVTKIETGPHSILEMIWKPVLLKVHCQCTHNKLFFT